jgi:hypothetical protein
MHNIKSRAGSICVKSVSVRMDCWSFLALCFFLLSPLSVNGQWVQTSGPTGGIVGHVAAAGDCLFASTAAGLFRSTDRGWTWAIINTGLPGPPIVRGVVAVPNGTGGKDLYLPTGYGVFRSTNFGTSWSSRSTGLTDKNVILLTVDTISAGNSPGLDPPTAVQTGFPSTMECQRLQFPTLSFFPHRAHRGARVFSR